MLTTPILSKAIPIVLRPLATKPTLNGELHYRGFEVPKPRVTFLPKESPESTQINPDFEKFLNRRSGISETNRRFITKEGIHKSSDIENLIKTYIEQKIVELKVYEDTGVIPTSTMSTEGNDFESNVWFRDFALCLYAAAECGQEEVAAKGLKAMWGFLNSQITRPPMAPIKFIRNYENDGIEGSAGYFRSPVQSEDLFHIRSAVNPETGFLKKSSEPWAQGQLDALGFTMWTTFKLAREGKIDLEKLDRSLKKGKGSGGFSIFKVLPQYVMVSKCWDNIDMGPWESENDMGWMRASSVGACLAGFNEVRDYFTTEEYSKNMKGFRITREDDGFNNFSTALDRVIDRCQDSINHRIGVHGEHVTEFAIEVDENGKAITDNRTGIMKVREADMALSTLLFLPDVLNEHQFNGVLKTLISELERESGMIRHQDDLVEAVETNDPDRQKRRWTLGDAFITYGVAQKYIETLNPEYYEAMDLFLRRMASQITENGNVPETWSAADDGFMSGIEPLQWATSMNALALKKAHEASFYYGHIIAKGTNGEKPSPGRKNAPVVTTSS